MFGRYDLGRFYTSALRIQGVIGASIPFVTHFNFFYDVDVARRLVYLTSCAALAAVTSSNTVGLDAMFFVGFGIWAFGFAIEVIADRQKLCSAPIRTTRINLSKQGCGPGRGTLITLAKSFFGLALRSGLSRPCRLAGTDLTGTDLGGVTNDRHQWTRMLEARANKTWGSDRVSGV